MRLFIAKRLVTCDPARQTSSDRLGVIEDGALLASGERIVAVGTQAEVSAQPDATGLTPEHAELITPGLVDAHTHAAWVGSRHLEYAAKMRGAAYEEIAKLGGGIVSSMGAVRAASQQAIAATLRERLLRMRAVGVTTVEIKSGYGLDLESEQKQLRAIACVAKEPGMPRVVATFLGLHAVPPEAKDNRAAYVQSVVEHSLPAIAEEGLARFVDAYIDRNAFQIEEARGFVVRAKQLGLGVRLHVGQFADIGGAELAAQFDASSADHLEQVSEVGAKAMALAGVRATLLPVASFTLRQAPPPVGLLREHGVKLVVASDSNPGTAPTESLPLAMALAVRDYGLSYEEALLGATREAAASLETDAGMLRAGAVADLALWDLPHEACLVQPWGVPRCSVVVAGR